LNGKLEKDVVRSQSWSKVLIGGLKGLRFKSFDLQDLDWERCEDWMMQDLDFRVLVSGICNLNYS
jgi:hypothetical protein